MRLTVTLFLLAVSLSLSTARVRLRTNVGASGETDFAQSHESPDLNEKHIKRLQIRNQTGLDGKVQRIYFDSAEDKPGIRAYGLPKKRLQDNGVIERVYVGDDQIDDASKSARLVEAYGMPKNDMKTNGFIERLSFPTLDRQSAKLDSRDDEIREERSIREGSENKVVEKTASEAEDMEAQDTKVFRPLFVYRQQMAARQNRKRARNLTHRYHRHANHQYCDH